MEDEDSTRTGELRRRTGQGQDKNKDRDKERTRRGQDYKSHKEGKGEEREFCRPEGPD